MKKVIIHETLKKDDPRPSIRALESAVRAICTTLEQDQADAVMLLMTTAAHIAITHESGTRDQTIMALARCLGYATVSAERLFHSNATLEPANER